MCISGVVGEEMCTMYTEQDAVVNSRLVLKNVFYDTATYKAGFVLDAFHSHQGYEITFVHEGDARFHIEDEYVDLKKGDLVIVDPAYPHDTEILGEKEMTRTVVHFSKQFVGNMLELWQIKSTLFPWVTRSKFQVLRRAEYCSDHVETWLNMLVNGQPDDSATKPLFVTHLLGLILLEIVRAARLIENNGLKDIKQNDLVWQTIKHIDENIASPPSLDVISQKLNVSKFHLSRIFKKSMGLSFRQFVYNRRLLEAKRLVACTDLPIGEISDMLGYSSCAAFSRAFTSMVGQSPIEYRSKEQKQQIFA